MFYITTILVMYLLGLILIFVHYMNSSYGKWNWTLSDAWDELTPAFFNQRYFYDNKLTLLDVYKSDFVSQYLEQDFD